MMSWKLLPPYYDQSQWKTLSTDEIGMRITIEIGVTPSKAKDATFP